MCKLVLLEMNLEGYNSSRGMFVVTSMPSSIVDSLDYKKALEYYLRENGEYIDFSFREVIGLLDLSGCTGKEIDLFRTLARQSYKEFRKAVSDYNCDGIPLCEECSKYSLKHRLTCYWKCDKTCKEWK